MSIYPKLVLKSEDLGVWVLEPGFNPPSVVRTLGEGRQCGPGPVSLGGIIAQLDLREWEQVEDTDQFFRPAEERAGKEMMRASTAFSSAELERALEGPLTGLVHELYFKSSHYGIRGSRFLPGERDKFVEKFRSSGWMDSDIETDPISALLSEVHAIQFAASVPEDTAEVLDKWERAESTINARLRAACELLGPKALSNAVAAIGPDWVPVPPLAVTSTKALLPGKRSDSKFGQPDLLLYGDGTLILIEMKVRGGLARAKYDANQCFKYLRLAEEARRRHGSTLRTLHILTAPIDAGRVIQRHQTWLKQRPVHGSNLEINTDGLLAALPPRPRAKAMTLGGTSWLKELVAKMPCRLIDFRSLIAAVGSVAPPTPPAERELARQLAACVHFGCPSE